MIGIQRCERGRDERVFIDAAIIYPRDSGPYPRNALGSDWCSCTWAFFELKDLVMNTVGAFVGALISAGVRKVVAGRKSRVIGEGHI